MPIEYVDENAYQAFLEPVHTSDECVTHIALVHSTETGAFQGYVKLYLSSRADNHGLPNEVAGQILAEALKLPVPKQCLVLVVSGKRLAEIQPVLKAQLKPKATYALWVTERVGKLGGYYEEEEFLGALRRWSKLPDVVAFDDWIANEDRTLKNLIRSGVRNFTLIDHGHLGGGIYWTSDSLDPAIQVGNSIASMAWPAGLGGEDKDRIVVAAEHHLEAFADARMALDQHCKRLLSAPEHRALMNFLEMRARSSVSRLKRQLGLLV